MAGAWIGVCVGVGDGVSVAVGVLLGVWLAVGLAVGEGVSVCVGDAAGVAVLVGGGRVAVAVGARGAAPCGDGRAATRHSSQRDAARATMLSPMAMVSRVAFRTLLPPEVSDTRFTGPQVACICVAGVWDV